MKFDYTLTGAILNSRLANVCFGILLALVWRVPRDISIASSEPVTFCFLSINVSPSFWLFVLPITLQEYSIQSSSALHSVFADNFNQPFRGNFTLLEPASNQSDDTTDIIGFDLADCLVCTTVNFIFHMKLFQTINLSQTMNCIFANNHAKE